MLLRFVAGLRRKRDLFDRHLFGWRRRARNDAVMQRLAPKALEILLATSPLPIVAHDFIARLIRLAEQDGQEFVRRATAVKRRDQRLKDRRLPS